jgi:hypothetical protein
MRQDLPDYAESVFCEFLSVFDSLLSCHGTAACHYSQPDVCFPLEADASITRRQDSQSEAGFWSFMPWLGTALSVTPSTLS